MLDKSQSTFDAVEMDAEETPVVPVVTRHLRFFVSDNRLFILVNPAPVAARRALDDLLCLSYVIVVQRLTIGIQYRLINHLRLHDMAFEPSAAARTFDIKGIVTYHDVDY